MSDTAQTRQVLLVEANDEMRERCASLLESQGIDVTGARDPDEALALLETRHYDAIVASLDARVLDLKRRAHDTPLLVLCDPGRVAEAVGLLPRGVEDYLLRPPDPFELKARLERILERHDLDYRIAFFQNEVSKKHVKTLEARSPAMRAVLERVMRVAPMRSTVLVRGESGVGKELVARSIHFNSPRRDRPFIALNCAAIPAGLIESELFGHEKGSFTGAHVRVRGKFEIAHRGTLFLDEIGEMDLASQVKLLRVLEDQEFMRIGGDRNIRVDVRVIAATNADLEELVATSRFRQDLYYRLKVVIIEVPPLRERRLDTPALVEAFLGQLSRANAVENKTITDEALAAILDYGWPGNVRELKNLLENLLVSTTGGVIRAEDLPAYVHRGRPETDEITLQAGTTLAAMERELIRRTLRYTGGNRTHSAALLGIGVRTLQRKILAYGLKIAPTRRGRPSPRDDAP